MTVSSVKTGAVGISFALDNNYMEPIATTLVGSGGVNQVTFNDIPQTYKHLQLRVIGKNTRISGYEAGTFTARFNADAGNNYANHILYGDGGTTYSFPDINASYFYVARIADNTRANVFGTGICDILDYTNTNKNTTTRSISGVDTNVVGELNYHSGVWLNTNAITSITVFSDTFLIMQYSRFSLYGIKG